MNELQPADALWDELVAILRHWAVERGGSFVKDLRGTCFDHRTSMVAVDGVTLRLTRDRGDILLDVQSGGRWHSAKNLLAFTLSMPPEAAADWIGTDLNGYLGGWNGVLAALRHPGLPDYERAIGNATMAKLRARGRAMRASGQPNELVRLQGQSPARVH